MADVETQRHPLRVGVLQESFDLLFVFDVGLGVGVENEPETEGTARKISDTVGRVDQAPPAVVVQCPWFDQFAGEQVGVGTVDQHEVAGARGGQQFARAFHLLLQFGPPDRVFEVPHGEGARHLQVAPIQFPAKSVDIRGQVAVGSQLDPFVAGFGDLVHEPLPGGLPGIVGKPHAPGIGRAADADVHESLL